MKKQKKVQQHKVQQHKVQQQHWIEDTSLAAPDKIAAFVHCKKCLEELPPTKSPKEWQDVEAGLTKKGGVQIWCKRHDVNIYLLERRAG